MIVKFLRVIIVALALLPVVATAEPITLKLSYFSSDRTAGYLAGIKPFVDAVNDEANGLLHIKVYFSGALGKDQSKTAQSVLDGTVDMAFVVPGLAPRLFYNNKVMEMPGLFRDAREASLVFTRLIAAGALKGYEKFFVIEAIASAPETIHTRPPVASLRDLSGKAIGINNETQGVALEKLSMHPVFLPATDAAMAISSGKIDGVAKSPSILFDFGITRFTTYHYLLGTSVVPLALLMSRKKFDSLPKQAQAIIQKYSGEWAAARFIDGYREDNKRALEKLRSDPLRKVITPSPADLNTAQAAFNSVIAEWAAKSPHNRELLRLVESALAKLRSTP